MGCDVFISYSRGDREMVASIARRLEERGLSVWYDARIEAEAGFNDDISEALKSAKIMALFFSEECNASKQVARELAMADEMGKPVVPVLLEHAAPRGSLLFDLADRNWVKVYPEPFIHADALAALLARVAGKQLPGGLSHSAPTNPAAYVGRQDPEGRPSELVTGKTYRILNMITLGLYGWVAWDGAIRRYEDNIRKL
jgi:hypothetical protein